MIFLQASLLASLPLCLLATDPPVSEVEPNQTRDTATPANLGIGGSFTGTSRGFNADPASTATDTRDIWRVTLTADPTKIQRHRLQLTTTGTQGHTGSIMGVQANSGVIDPTSMIALQNTSISTVPARHCIVYTLGVSAPYFLYRLTGSSGTTLPYTITETSDAVTPTVIRSCPFIAGAITITTVGRTSLDTKLFLYNADTLAPIEGGLNDDAPPSSTLSTGSPQSLLTRTLTPGHYLLAISNGGTVDNRLPPADDRTATSQSFAYVTESPGLLVNSSSTATGDFSFTISDISGITNASVISAAKPGAYGIAFYRFDTQTRCSAADMGSVGAQPCFDNALDNNDFIVFIGRFFSGSTAADIGMAGGLPGSDNRWDNNDWIVYVNEFFTGCG